MIKVNNTEIKVGHFPDGTQSISFPDVLTDENLVTWLYDSDEEIFTMMSVMNWIRRNTNLNSNVNLFLPYVPNARMDRIKNNDENFALKVFADFINSLNFNIVLVNNVHSNVSEALINRIINQNPGADVDIVIKECQPDVIFFPDEGACKRYSDLQVVKDYDHPVAFGIKKRDWKTGKIQGLDVVCDVDLTGKTVLIVDDICSAGGTFKFSAMKLKEMGASNVVLYVSHCEDNIQNGDLLKTDLISKIYTTDSILHIADEKIELVQKFR